MHALDRLIAEGPDPQGARPLVERFVDQGGALPTTPEGQALLAALLANGGFLADIILSDVDQFTRLAASPWLRRTKPRALLTGDVHDEVRGASSFTDLMRRLRIARRREMLRLGAREIGWGTTEEVARELSALADACLEAAVHFCDAELRAGYGAPVATEGAAAFVVLGMGKLGGEELNFSSDVDLIYLYSTDEGRAGTLTLHEYYSRLSLAVTRALSELTGDGLVFRVDLRLRPEGRSGAVCNSLAAAESYYETFGRTWERQALLRARPCAGDTAFGDVCLHTLEPFVFPRSLGAGSVDEVRALRRLFRDTPGQGGFNVKLGAGGIRDVELVAQLLQLLYAGQRRELRERTTLPALRKLRLGGLLSDHEERTLATAYRFWRRVEHRVQLEQGAQTHELPATEEGLSLMARRLGFVAAPDFGAEVQRHAAAVAAIAETLGEPERGLSAVVLRLLDPASSRPELEARLGAAGFSQPEASADALDLARGRLPGAWLEEAITSPDPDRALVHFRDLALHGSLGLFALLRDEPTLLRMLASLFGTSDRLSRHLISHPGMWEPLVDGLGEPRPTEAQWRQALPARIAGLDFEEALREMRRYQTEEILRIGLHHVAGNLDPVDVSAQLTALAEACLGRTVELVAGTLEARHGRPDAALTVLGLGSFGARELRYGSDLDLVFLYARPGTTAGGMDHQEWFARLAQRVIGALGARLDEGRLYEVDTRLRPSGEQGMLVTSYAAFDRYHEETAAPWERVALLRARPVFASAPDDFAGTLDEITYGRPIDTEQLRGDLLRMRGRIEDERGRGRAGAVHLRLSPGGLTDLEFMAAYGQLLLGAGDPTLRTTSPVAALDRLAARGFLDPDGATLADDHRFLQRAALGLRLLRDTPDDWVAPDDLPVVARALDMTEAVLQTELTARMNRVRQAFTRVLGVTRPSSA